MTTVEGTLVIFWAIKLEAGLWLPQYSEDFVHLVASLSNSQCKKANSALHFQQLLSLFFKVAFQCLSLSITYHRASSTPPFKPFMFPGRHTRCLEFLPDHALFWAVIHFLQPPEGFFILHVTTTVKKKQNTQMWLLNTVVCLTLEPP